MRVGDPRDQGHARHPARRDAGLAPHRGRGARASSPATATARSAPRSSRRPSSSPAASAPRPTSSPRRCTPSTDRDEARTSLTLRPEATAGIVRAVIEHNLMNTDPALKVYAMGPMFRRERPQKGRYRQFHQVDVEAFGMASPSVDVEVDRDGPRLPGGLRLPGGRAGPELGGRRKPAGRVRRDPARRPARERSRLCRRQPAADGDEPPARARLEGPRGPGGDRRPAPDRRPPVRPSAATTSTR